MKVTWTEIKTFVDDRDLSVQYVELDNHYLIAAIDGGFILEATVRKTSPANSDQTDFEDNYKAEGNKTPTTQIREENKRTGGHYQAKGFEFDVGSGDSTKTLDITFPFPISLLAAEWCNKTAFDGDSIEFQVAPDTIIGSLSANEASGQTVLSVAQSVINNIDVGRKVKLDDGTNSDDCGYVTAVDDSANTITVETATTNSFLAATPTYVKMTTIMLVKSPLDDCGRIQLGESKIGGSYIPANTTLRGIYYNDISTAKKLRFYLEYLY